MTVVEENIEEKVDAPPQLDYEFAFVVMKLKNGTYGVRPLQMSENVTTDQVYQGCDRILTNMRAQQTAGIIANEMMKIVQAANGANGGSGLVVPDHVKRA